MMAERPSALVLGLTVDLLVLRLAFVLAFGFAGDLRDEVVTFLDSAWLIIHFFIHQDWQWIV